MIRARKVISATELVRKIGDILGRTKFRGESFVIEKNGTPVALLIPLPSSTKSMSIGDVLELWKDAGPPDPELADILEQVGREDRPLETPWDSSSTPAP